MVDKQETASVCLVGGCGRIRTGSSRYCGTHVSRLRRHGDPNANFRRRRGICCIEGCLKPHRSHGLCAIHEARRLRHGNPTVKLGRKGDGRTMCAVDGCARPNKSYGLCAMHRARLVKWGNTTSKRCVCVRCGLTFTTVRGSQRFCKPRCALEHYRNQNRLRIRKYWHEYEARKRGSIAESFSSQDVFARDKWMCQLCHKPIRKSLRHPHRLSGSIDHIIPVSCGGSHSLDNVQAAHYSCNSKKNSKALGQMRLRLSA